MADLKGAVEEVLKPGFEVENPVTRARGVQKLDEHAMPDLDVLRGDILELRKGMKLRLCSFNRGIVGIERGDQLIHLGLLLIDHLLGFKALAD
jgi:hypothetical protein